MIDDWAGIRRLVIDAQRYPLLSPEASARQAQGVVNTREDLWCALLDYLPMAKTVVSAAKARGGMDAECEVMAKVITRALAGRCGDHEYATACRAAASTFARLGRQEDARRLVSTFRVKSDDDAAQLALLTLVLGRHDAARQRFAAHNVRLTLGIVRKTRGWLRSMPVEDMVQEGCIGLMTAVDRFDPSKGYKFSTYAYWWIGHMIVRGAVDRGRLVRVPSHVHDRAYVLLRVARSIYDKTNEWPSPEETAKAAGIELRKVMSAYEAFGSQLSSGVDCVATSMSAPLQLGDGFKVTLEDTLSSADVGVCVSQEDRIDTDSSAGQALRVLEGRGFTDRERMIVRARFGLGASGPSTLDELGKRIGITRERVRQVEMKAIVKIRKAMTRAA